MPRLNTLIEVGFCTGYGDGDYRVSTQIATMSRERFNELKLATLSAIQCAEAMWRREHQPEPGQQQEPRK